MRAGETVNFDGMGAGARPGPFKLAECCRMILQSNVSDVTAKLKGLTERSAPNALQV
ncbi:hypothetical protein [Aureimonas sp. AU20]|uniref:hypothetical protein n=1 Tax=Aureimonas sp. AU20 TaxID=1349819 RepID=UPI000B2DD94B|nr:hypothetical protein [Aureimonas sp. AU20]